MGLNSYRRDPLSYQEVAVTDLLHPVIVKSKQTHNYYAKISSEDGQITIIL